MPDGTPNPVDVHVGKKIFTRRIELGLSMEKLASSVGLTFQQVQKYERGMNRVSASRLFDFSKVLGVPINYFSQIWIIRRSKTVIVCSAVSRGKGKKMILMIRFAVKKAAFWQPLIIKLPTGVLRRLCLS